MAWKCATSNINSWTFKDLRSLLITLYIDVDRRGIDMHGQIYTMLPY